MEIKLASKINANKFIEQTIRIIKLTVIKIEIGFRNSKIRDTK